jgi:hypothetical protein
MAPPQLSSVGKLRLTPPCHSFEAGATDSEGPCTLAPATRSPGTQGSSIAGVLIDEGTTSEGTHGEDTYLSTLGIATAIDTVAPPPTDHQTEHPDVPVEVSLTQFSVPWSRGASATLNLIRSDTSKSPFSSPRPPGSWTTPRLGTDAGGGFNIDIKSTLLSYTQMTSHTGNGSLPPSAPPTDGKVHLRCRLHPLQLLAGSIPYNHHGFGGSCVVDPRLCSTHIRLALFSRPVML